MDGYYDYYPTHHLDRPLVLVSFVNRLTRQVAHTVASLTGVPLRLIDELVEHEVGASAHRAIKRYGLPAWREWEGRELAKALDSKPPGVIAVGEGVLSDPENLSRVLERAELVYLRLAEREACRRASQQSAHHSASLWAEAASIGAGPAEALQALFEGRRFIYGLAHRTIDVSNHSALEIAKQLLVRMPPVSP